MKHLFEYINESLQPKLKKWIDEVYKTMEQLIKDNKVEPIDVDIKKLAKPDKSFEFDDFMMDQSVRKIISNKSIGFTVLNQMCQIPKKYLVDKTNDEEKEIKPKCLPYWYRPVDDQDKSSTEIPATYFIGMVLYDDKVSYLDNFLHIVGIETSLCVKESTPVLKGILNDFSLHYLNKLGKFSGLTAKPVHPKMKAILIKLGFSPIKDDKNILTYKL
jgi:hypothetical protein